MLAVISDGTWNVLHMQHLTTNSKRWDYSDVPGGGHKQIKGPAYMCESVSMPWGHPGRLMCWSEGKYDHVYINQSRWEDLESFCANAIEIELWPCLGVHWKHMQITIISFVLTKLIGDHYFIPWDLIVVSTLYWIWRHFIIKMWRF